MTALKPDLPNTETEAARTTVNRPKLSATQLTASVLAAVTATVAASYLGVAGTVIGAALASVLTVVGNAVYGHSIARTGERVRAAVPATWLPAADEDTVAVAPEPATTAATKINMRRLGVACLGVFAVINVAIFAVELVAGKPLSDLLRGENASGTTFTGSSVKQSSTPSTPAPVTVIASVVVETPTVTQTAPAVTATVTPTVTTTPTPTASATSGTPSPSDSSTP